MRSAEGKSVFMVIQVGPGARLAESAAYILPKEGKRLASRKPADTPPSSAK
jgi:hypothetical protein